MGFIVTVNIIAVVLSYFAKYKKCKFLFSFAFILLTVIYSLRYDFGNDYWGYFETFHECQIYDSEDLRIEIGWYYLCKLCAPIGFFGLVIVTTIFQNLIVYKFIKKNVEENWWWLAVFIFTFNFNYMLLGCSMMRQYTAMVLCLWASQYILNKRFILFAFFVGLAISMHTSAILFALTYFFAYFRPSLYKKYVIMISLVVVCVMIAFSELIDATINQFLTLAFFESYETYSDWEAGTKSLGIVFELMMMAILMFSHPKQESNIQIYNCTMLLYYFIMPFTFVILITNRLSFYYSLFSLACFPYAIKEIKMKPIQIMILVIFVFFTGRRFVQSITGETYGLFYQTFNTIFDSPSWL